MILNWPCFARLFIAWYVLGLIEVIGGILTLPVAPGKKLRCCLFVGVGWGCDVEGSERGGKRRFAELTWVHTGFMI